MNPIILDENVYLPMNAKNTNEHLVHFKKDNDSSQSDEEEEDQKTAINVVAPTPQIFYKEEENPAPLLQIKRSFSDSDLRNLILVINEDSNEKEVSSAKQISHNRLKRASTRYSKVCRVYLLYNLSSLFLRPIIQVVIQVTTISFVMQLKSKQNN